MPTCGTRGRSRTPLHRRSLARPLVVGEQQILGQIRGAYASADAHRTAGRVLHELAQQALRVGKRVHSETGIDRAGASVVSVAAPSPRRPAAAGTDLRRGVVPAPVPWADCRPCTSRARASPS